MKLTRKEVGELGLYDFQSYIGAMNQPTFGGRHGTLNLIKNLGIPEKSLQKKISILEIACSTGYNTCEIAQKYNCDIIGIDISEISIVLARERKKKLHLDNCEFKIADAMNLPFDDNTFDIVFAEAIIALLPEKGKILHEIMRVTKPGGCVGTLEAFIRSGTSEEILMEINNVMTTVMGFPIAIKNLDAWKELFAETKLKNIQIQDYYDSVFDRSYKFWETLSFSMKLIYYLITNKKIRQKIMPTMKLARKMINKNSPIIRNLGYFIFTGEK
ncbi:class I SAM-dependent methyltransferase [Promethearchaeum syntrophicum]|uniref:Class I SAM-dependent methyltransferase n=1 Tax=Promethearchaeum syntrophicum TaxID=2594042 RepID=A0A5B9D5M4_9ARCH|nr:class I SAM-dependent methyltransferase [Candidatus Prometheoarchaeum syntrophicum]